MVFCLFLCAVVPKGLMGSLSTKSGTKKISLEVSIKLFIQ